MNAIDRRGDLLGKLTEGISRLTDSTEWQRHLDCQSRFHHYSFGNVVLIAAQCPGASRVAGFHTWKKLERTVRKGEKAVWILAPMVAARDKSADPGDDRVIRGFKFVPVFDVSQTGGAALPAVCHALTGEEPAESLHRLTEAAGAIGYSVVEADLPDGVHGDCAFGLRRIRLESRNSSAQRLKTLAHEIAHAFLHAEQPDRPRAELEAESAAYVICRRMGLDTGAYSFGYVATWAGGGPEAVSAIKTSCANIQQAAQFMLGHLGLEEDGPLSVAAA